MESKDTGLVGELVFVKCFGRSYPGRIAAVGRTRVRVDFRTPSNGTQHSRSFRVEDVSIGHALAERLTRALTCSDSLYELLNAKGGYRPTILQRDVPHRLLVQAYDRAQARRGDPRRAFTGNIK